MRYLITFSYDGTLFNGYQSQPGKRTVQSEIEKALQKINDGKRIRIYASGRTDTKVHALGQKAHFDLDLDITLYKLKCGLNSNLPDDIHINKVEIVDESFNARFTPHEKEYRYILNMGEYNPLERNHVYQYNRKLDLEMMQKAIKYFIGEHNFKAFTPAKNNREDYVRKITYADITEVDEKLIFTFKGNGFLKYQVRNMVGLLIQIGNGKRDYLDVPKIIESQDRRNASITAHPEGLYLVDVKYEEGV